MNSLPLSESIPLIGNGVLPGGMVDGLYGPLAGLRPVDGPAGVAMSVMVNVYKQYLPVATPPSWVTRSISTNPGAASSQFVKVRIEIWCFNSDPGLVRARPRNLIRDRWSASIRSIVAVEIWASSSSSTVSVTVISLLVRSNGASAGMKGVGILPVGARSNTQHRTRAGSSSSP